MVAFFSSLALNPRFFPLMNQTVRNMRKLANLCIAGLAGLLASCTIDSTGGEPAVRADQVTFTIAVPENMEGAAPVTYAQTPDDQRIVSIDALIFHGDTRKFIERVKITQENISGTGAFKSFSFPYAGTAEPRIVHFIVNGRTGSEAAATDVVNFGILTAGLLESESIPKLTFSIPANVYLRATDIPVPMWGRVGLANLPAGATVAEPVPVLRTLAAVTVESDTPTPENGLGTFTIHGFTLKKTPSEAYIAPSNYTAPAAQPVAPSLTSYMSHVGYGSYTGTIGSGSYSGSWAMLPANKYMYLPEQKYDGHNHAATVTLLVSATYAGQPYLYAIPLVTGNDVATAAPIPIVRNIIYKVKITSATPGFSTDAEALDSPATLHSQITNSNNDVYDIVSDGFNWLGVSRKVTLPAGTTWITPTAIGSKVYTNLNQNEIVIVSVNAEPGSGISGVTYNTADGLRIGTLSAGTPDAKATVTVKAKNLTRQIVIERM